jgi:hypothetical protein
MSRPRQVLVIRFNKKAARMLVEFANTGPKTEEIAKFTTKWKGLFGLKWPSGESSFLASQRIVRKYWQGMKKGIEGIQIGVSLGLRQPDYAEEGEALISPPFSVDAEGGALFLDPRDLEQFVWLTLLQHSRRLGVCKNPDGSSWCHPYFIKYRARQKFCSDACAAPAKRDAKLKWWHENRSPGAGTKVMQRRSTGKVGKR